MKNFLCFLFAALIFIFPVSAFAEDYNVGVLEQLNMNEDDYRKFVLDRRNSVGWDFLSHGDEKFIYYSSLVTMQMALNAGEINEIQLPEIVGEYFINSNPSAYTVACVSMVRPTYLAFGFLSSNTALRDRFNAALQTLREEGTLENLRLKYIENAHSEKIKFEKFDGAEKIRVALTGDLPPIDFVEADGTPAGYNVAIISEIAKKMKVNIEILNVESGSRSANLASKRADAVFWYKVTRDLENQPDVPENVILSEPYYEWNKFLHVKRK